MKKSYRLVGLDCPNCADKMQKAIGKLDGVNEVTVSAMTAKMVLDAQDDKFDNIVVEAEKIVKKLEPHVVMKRA